MERIAEQKEVMMMNQYMKETSQIHAPADLIQRTKQAVQEEELRIQQEKEQMDSAVPVSESADAAVKSGQIVADSQKTGQQQTGRKSGINTGKVYRWALPVAAAATVLLLINVAVMAGNRFGKFSMNAYSGGMSAEDTASYDAAPEAVMETAEAECDDAMLDFTDQQDSDGAAVEREAGISESKSAGADMYDGGGDILYANGSKSGAMESEEAAVAAEKDDIHEDAVADVTADAGSGGSEEAASEYSEAGLFITEVEEIPDFVEDKNTKCILHRGFRFYVVKERDNQWTAYVQADGVRYVITGDCDGMTDQEKFVGKAYERLAETVEDVE